MFQSRTLQAHAFCTSSTGLPCKEKSMVRKDEGTPSEFSPPEYAADAFGACAMKVSSVPQPIESR